MPAIAAVHTVYFPIILSIQCTQADRQRHLQPVSCIRLAGPPPPTDVAHLTLPDGRLNVGTHLPLLAKRYRYLSTLGEGASAQVTAAYGRCAAVILSAGVPAASSLGRTLLSLLP
jgi:hypothetical protein